MGMNVTRLSDNCKWFICIMELQSTKKKRKAIVSETTIIIKSRLIDGNFHVRQKSKKEKVNNFTKKKE